MDHTASARPPGRPRDASIDERVLSVVRDLLVEVGWHGLSVRLVAARAGVGRASLTRRWPSKEALVLHAILGEAPDLTPFSGTDVNGWIDWVVRGSHELFGRAEVKAAVPGLLLAFQANDELRRLLWTRFSGPAVELFATDLNAIGSEERRRAHLDARAVLAMAAGAALFLTTVAIDDDTTALQARIADLLTVGVHNMWANRLDD